MLRLLGATVLRFHVATELLPSMLRFLLASVSRFPNATVLRFPVATIRPDPLRLPIATFCVADLAVWRDRGGSVASFPCRQAVTLIRREDLV